MTITIPEMTRFLMNIDQAIDTVFAALKDARPGETYVPVVGSATVENVAKALVGHRDIETKIIGTRPGEKVHEILISEEEYGRVVRRGDYYVIKPLLPELQTDTGETIALTKEYSSSDNILDLESTVALLKKNKLMLEDVRTDEEGELLR